MGDLLEEQCAGLDHPVAMTLVKAASRFAGIQHHALGAGRQGAMFEFLQERSPDASAFPAGLHGHEANLRFRGGIEMKASDAQQATAGPATQVDRFRFALVMSGGAGLRPGLA